MEGSINRVYVDFDPSSERVQEEDSETLLLFLPGLFFLLIPFSILHFFVGCYLVEYNECIFAYSKIAHLLLTQLSHWSI